MAPRYDHAGRSSKQNTEASHKSSNKAPSFSSSTSVNPLKTKIRDVTRLLDRSEHLPPGVRIEKERALAGYKLDLEHAEQEKRRQQMIKKYHMVRFFDRKRAMKNLNRLNAQLTSTSSNAPGVGELQKVVHDAEVDVNYAIYHPLEERYSSLFPRDKEPSPEEPALTEPTKRPIVAMKPPMWKVVEECMETGRLPDLRDGKLRFKYSTDSTNSVPRKKEKTNKGGQDTTQRTQKGQDISEESDGGFFDS